MTDVPSATSAGVPSNGPLPPLAVAGRLERLRARLAEAEADVLVVTSLANIRYLTGFTGSAAILAVAPEAAVLTTDGRYRTQSAQELGDAGVTAAVEIVVGGLEAQRSAVRALVADGGAHAVGLEAAHISWDGSRRWGEVLAGSPGSHPIELVPTVGVVEALREVKDAGEIARMARAAEIADLALAQTLPLLSSAARGTVTELDVALALDTAMRRLGAEDRAFDTIVAAGPNSARPHHQPTDRPIAAGDPVVIDFGAIYEGYRSDTTRTFCIGGEPSGELARIFEVVRHAQADGVSAVRAGVAANDVDHACREVIAEAGWADRFEHGTGHGVGLDIHEAPTVGPTGTAILASGTIVTVEPGVYIPGTGGVRIEDTLVVTDDGSRSLTNFSKDIAA